MIRCPGATLASSDARPSILSADRRTVLIVDDDLEVRATLKRVLRAPYEVTIADNGETALSRLEHGERFDVVLLDVNMPRMDGAAFMEHLRRLDPDQAKRVIILTGNWDTPSAPGLVGHYIVEKPFELGKLRELIDRVSAAVRAGSVLDAD